MWDENKVRIVDVADALGLSTATVSNVIHGKTKKSLMVLCAGFRRNSAKWVIFRTWLQRFLRRIIPISSGL